MQHHYSSRHSFSGRHKIFSARMLGKSCRVIGTIRPFSTMRDPYAVLGVDRNTSQEDIKSRFRELAKRHHPDLNTNDADASKKMADITNAYDILTDKRKKAEFDRSSMGGYSASSGDSSSHSSAEWVDPNQMFSEFSNIFGRMGRHRPVARLATRGDDISMPIEIDLVDAMSGCVRNLTIKCKQSCSSCSGSGARPGTGWTSCKTCKGTGTQRVERGIMTMGMPCVRCGGSGQTIEHPCLSCRGEGIRSEPKQVSVKVPSGVRNMMELRIQGQGHCGSRGGRSGDLFVTVKVKPDDYFTIIDDDVYVEMPITIRDVLLGTSVKVRSIEPQKPDFTVAIPPGTLPGTTRTLPGRGPPRPISGNSIGSRGDMVLKIALKIQPIETLTDRQKQLIEEFNNIQCTLLDSQKP
jgi:molecular chaperone DnaJ